VALWGGVLMGVIELVMVGLRWCLLVGLV